jgi:hypothetical protein
VVLFAAGLLTFVSFMALVVDVGYLYAVKSRTQAVLDGTSLAVALALDPARPLRAQEPFVRALALRLLAINGLNSSWYQVDLDVARPPVPGPSPAGSLLAEAPAPVASIRIVGRERVDAFFSRAMGCDVFTVGVAATAQLVASPGGSSLSVLKE